jgi:hypothetical protein
MGLNTLRILSDNIADYASFFPSSEALGFPVVNVITDNKGKVFRSTSSILSLLLTWDSVQTLSCLILPFCSLSNTSTIRVRLYSDAVGSVLLLDTGICAVPEIIINTTNNTGIYKFNDGATNTRSIYFNKTSNVIRVLIDINEPLNSVPYIELSRILMGNYWSPAISAEYGYSVEIVDTSTSSRNLSGTLATSKGTLHKCLKFTLPYMQDTDRTAFLRIQSTNGMYKSMFISLFPNDVDPNNEQTYQVYGRLSNLDSINHPNYGQFTSSVTIEEV